MQANIKNGLVIRVTGGDVWVKTEGRDVVKCSIRGKFRLKSKDFQLAAGDRVKIQPPDTGTAWTIEALEPRESSLSRYIERDGTERVIVANINRLYVITTLESPPVHYGFIDRVLVSAAWGNVDADVVLNKSDLISGEDAARFADLYESCGYNVLCTSALTGDGVSRLNDELCGGVYAFVGESGVGKSSLLMSIDPGLDLVVREIGAKSGRGRHTTSFSQLYDFGGGYIADTPGVQTFGFPGADGAELPDCFPEFEPHMGSCRFFPCTHSHEPDCGVKAAVESGVIPASRHKSYLNILSDVEAREKKFGR